jgi:uncharacterized protein YndB with AHSA1/START domain
VGARRNSGEARLSLPSDREIVIVREFQAPRVLLFAAWTNPEHVKRWYPCSTLTMTLCEMDVRVGGKWRWVQRSVADSKDHVLSGEYREVVRPSRLVFTQRYEPMPGSDHVVTLTFEESDGMTTMTEHFLHPSRENRDGHLKSGIETGLRETFARLDELLASMAIHLTTAAGERG